MLRDAFQRGAIVGLRNARPRLRHAAGLRRHLGREGGDLCLQPVLHGAGIHGRGLREGQRLDQRPAVARVHRQAGERLRRLVSKE
ncbi:hypothetical protein GALL_520870 [mine drainage metagenome]|uniref:Uncharacterized protein n=1 Tax=mine drainage metagenome TaxID=410659 RepID=A0A1J5P6F7_9ZZZZ